MFPTTDSELRRVPTEGDAYRDGDVTYLFAGDALERISLLRTEVVFEPALDTSRAGEGRYTITSYPDRGVVGGAYRVTASGEVSELTLGIDRVNLPRQRGIIYRLVVSDSSLFAQWPTHYTYRATIDRAAGTIDAAWTNAQPD